MGKSYEASFKVKVVSYSEQWGKRAASREFKVDRRRVQEWASQKAVLEGMCKERKSGSKRCTGGGRPVRYIDIDDHLIKWLKDRRSAGVRVTGKALKEEALRLHKITGNQSFKASCQWFSRFKRRHGISFRRTTHISQKSVEVTDTRVDSFLKFVMRMRRNEQYGDCYMGNMDETPVWHEMPGNTTLEKKGEKTIYVTSTGHEKKKFTVMLAALADGTKLTPLVLLPRKRPLPAADIPLGLAVYMCGTGKSWCNEEIIMYWLAKIWGRNNHIRRLLVWDSFRAHITPRVKQAVRSTFNSDMAVIPGGCTSKLQPADVSWNKPFKSKMAELYDQWVFSGEVTLTRGGNRQPPTMKLFLKWVKLAWDSVSVKKSFKKCGISNLLDGTEDDAFQNSDTDSDESANEFEGFTAEEILAADEYNQNIASRLTALTELSDGEDDGNDSKSDSASETMSTDYDSPGH